MQSVFRMSLALLGVAVSASPALSADSTRAVKLPRGAAAITLKGTIAGREGRNYIIQAKAGQTLQTLFNPSHTSCYYNVFEPGHATALHIGSSAGNEFGQNPTIEGNYKLQVYLMRNAARRGEKCRFSLSVELTGAPGVSTAGVSDTEMKDKCKGEAAPMYGVQPRRISVGAVRKVAAGYEIDGKADKVAEGLKKLRCIFGTDRTFSHIMAMTPDGE